LSDRSVLPGLGRVGLLGGGVIGGGWAARFLLNGVDVALYDPDPESSRKIGDVLDNARRAFARLTMVPRPPEGRLVFVDSPEAATAGADFVQESVPERLDLKRAILGRASAAADPAVVIATSTSGLRPTELQDGLAHPHRLVVGHPFNPVYLLPLVEICGGDETTAGTKDRAAEVYRAVGMRPLLLDTEIDGFVADRLLEALWREALWLVNDGVATVEQIDDAIRFGAGLRWSAMGTFLVYRIAGGEAGMRHFMSQFGPALQWPWTKLTEVPELTDELLERIVEQSDVQAGGRSIREWEALRDDCLVAVLQGLRSVGFGAGEVLAEYEHQLVDRAPCPAATSLPGPLRTHEAVIPADWVDYNGHTNDSRYAQLSCDASDALLRMIGMDAAYLAGGHSWFTAESHLTYVAQSRAHDAVHVTTQVLAFDPKRLHVFNRMYRSRRAGTTGEPAGDTAGDTLIATGEHLYLHVDSAAEKVVPAPPEMIARIAAIADSHAALERPAQAGRFVGAPRP
jgi:carnitine 3-dehydrogenase